jgi:hypothetical protein
MTAAIESVIVALQSLVPSDDDSENVGLLYEIFAGFRPQSGRELAMPAMFALLERFPDAEFGSPGPLVHELEAIAGYEKLLRESLHRQPTDLTVWMVNRILNAKLTQEQRDMWLNELRLAAKHSRSSESTRESAAEFLEHQGAAA